MGFDLSIRGFDEAKHPDRARTALQKLAAKSAVETWGAADAMGLGIGRLADKKVEKLYAALVKLAKKEGLVIHDPQAGRDISLTSPGKLPPGWTPPKPLDPKRFEAATEKLVKKHLVPLGYRAGQWGAERLVGEGHLLQRIQFSADGDRFKTLVDWRFFFDGVEDASWPAPYDLCDFIAETELEAEWPASLEPPLYGRLSADGDDLDRSLEAVRRAIDELVHPLLESIASLETLVAAFEDRRLGTVARQFMEPGRPLRDPFSMAFGTSPAGAARNMALSYRELGRLAEGAERYQQAIAETGDWMDLLDPKGKQELEAARALFQG